MKFIEKINGFTKEKTYTIYLKPQDNLNAEEIALCFEKQFPGYFCVVVFSEINKIELKIGFLLVGLRF